MESLKKSMSTSPFTPAARPLSEYWKPSRESHGPVLSRWFTS
ncbi:hypothetical protein [Enterocloster clostridioformis]|nr:hypothetical protein [Enterocloster clostridioformis]